MRDTDEGEAWQATDKQIRSEMAVAVIAIGVAFVGLVALMLVLFVPFGAA